jgi:polysaccharide chain length determinant protein (PEP-CTERM system associated)
LEWDGARGRSHLNREDRIPWNFKDEARMTERERTPAEYIAMLRRRWVLIAVLAAVGGPLAYGVSRVLPTKYKSQTTVLVEQSTVSADIVKPVDTTDISQRLSSMQQQILSRTRLEPVIRQFGLYPKDIDRLPMEDLVARLQKDIDVTPIQPMAETRSKDLPGFFVNVTLDNAQTAQQVCTAVTSMFIAENIRQRQQHSEDTTQFLTQQLADAKTNLDAQDAKLAAFKSLHLTTLPDEEQSNLNLLMTFTSQLDSATQALARAQQDKTFAESTLTQQVGAWQASQGGHNPETLETQLAALQTELASLQARYTDDYPDVIKTKNDIAALQRKIVESNDPKTGPGTSKSTAPSMEPAQIQQLRAQVHTYEQVIAEKTKEQEAIKQQIKSYQDRIQSSPVVEQQYKELTRGYETAQESYNDLLKKRDSSAMAQHLEQEQEGEQFTVLDPANLPDKPSFPNRPLFAAGGLGGGLALGLGIAFLLEMRDTSLRTERDVEFALRLPLLAMIPSIEPMPGQIGKQPVNPKAADQIAVGARS